MAPQLPFIVTPKSPEKVTVGDAAIGTLEIPKLGDLSVNERRYLKQLTKGVPDLKKEAVRMADEIAAKQNINPLDVYTALTSGDTVFLSDHLGVVLEFQEKMERSGEERETALATTIIKFRLVPEWEPEHTGNADLIHPDLMREVASFASNEESGWPKPLEEKATQPITEEDLGKSAAA